MPPTPAPASNPGFTVPRTFAALELLIPAAGLHRLVDRWLEEDCPAFDYGGAVVGQKRVSAILYQKSPGMVAGVRVFEAVFARVGCKVIWNEGIVDGVMHGEGRTILGFVDGPASAVLLGERVALNALAECSGVATICAKFSKLSKEHGWKGKIAGTRKTTPGFRLVQKYGMVVGGVDPHRMDLSSMVMLKDNHIAAAGGITGAVVAARSVAGLFLKIDVECGNLEEALEAAAAGADVVMLDNFGPDEFCRVAKLVKESFPKVIIEGSGGLQLETVAGYFCPQSDVLSLSVSRIAPPVDMSLKIRTVDEG